MMLFVLSALWSSARAQVQPTQRFDPELPSVALGNADLDERCVARVAVDPKGFVFRAEVSGCGASYLAATEAAVWRWIIPPPTAGATFQITARFAVVSPEAGGTGDAQVLVDGPVEAAPFPATDPPTVPISALAITKKKEPEVSAAMLFLSQDKGIVEVFCRAQIRIDEKGKVEHIAMHECHPDLDGPIEAAVRKWRFASEGGLAGGRQVTLIIPVRSFQEARGMSLPGGM